MNKKIVEETIMILNIWERFDDSIELLNKNKFFKSKKKLDKKCLWEQ